MLSCRHCVPNLDLGHFPPRVAQLEPAGSVVGGRGGSCLRDLSRPDNRQSRRGLGPEAGVDEAGKHESLDFRRDLPSRSEGAGVMWCLGVGYPLGLGVALGLGSPQGEVAILTAWCLSLGPPPASHSLSWVSQDH